ncbi:MAG: AI-2E family transporter [Woeseia sp.]
MNMLAPLETEGRRRPSSYSILTVATLVVLATLYQAADLLVPIAFAILLNFLLSPIVRIFQKFHIPAAFTAATLVVGLLATVVLIFGSLAEPAEYWLKEAPRSIRDLKSYSFSANERLADIQEIAAEVTELAQSDPPAKAQSVVVRGPGMFESIVGSLPSLLTFVGIVVFLTFFLLASGDTLLRRITLCGRSWPECRRIVTIARQVRSELSRYLLTVTAINFSLGLALSGAMYLLNVPNPFLWGLMTALFNFAPYLGAVASASILAIVGLSTFDTLAEAAMVPSALLVLTVLEGQLVTPAILGRRMALSPVFIFLSVIVWGWLWGVAGALMAVPIVTIIKVVCDNVPTLRPIGRFVRNEADGERGLTERVKPSQRRVGRQQAFDLR